MAKIFDPFFTTKFLGRGVGLASVLGIVRAHRGGIRVFSRRNGGTTFQILLLPMESQTVSIQPPRSAHGTVLVVDDEQVAATALSMLKALGLDVLTAHSVNEAVDLMRSRESVTAVLLDASLDGGVEALARLRAVQSDLPAIVSSSSYLSDAPVPSGTVFIEKPYTASDLKETLQLLLGD